MSKDKEIVIPNFTQRRDGKDAVTQGKRYEVINGKMGSARLNAVSVMGDDGKPYDFVNNNPNWHLIKSNG
jgi:hypothetical protein